MSRHAIIFIIMVALGFSLFLIERFSIAMMNARRPDARRRWPLRNTGMGIILFPADLTEKGRRYRALMLRSMLAAAVFAGLAAALTF